MINEGLQKGIQNLQPMGYELPNGDRIVIQIIVSGFVLVTLFYFNIYYVECEYTCFIFIQSNNHKQ